MTNSSTYFGEQDGGAPNPSEWHGQSVVPVTVILILTSCIAVGSRIYTRAVITKALGWSDWLILIAMTFAICLFGCTLAQIRVGLGSHFIYVQTLQEFFKISYLVLLFYYLVLTFTKLSITCLYLHILTYGYARLLTKVVLWIVILSHLWIICSVLTSCIPLQRLWTFEDGYCHPVIVWNANSVINIVTDVLIFALPLPGIFSLRLPRRKKIGLCIVFMLGFGICVISLVRLLFFLYGDLSDVTWESVTVACLNSLEINAGIICACLPTLWPLLVLLFPRFFNERQPVEGVERRYVTQPTIGEIATRRPLDPLESFTSTTPSNAKSNDSGIET